MAGDRDPPACALPPRSVRVLLSGAQLSVAKLGLGYTSMHGIGISYGVFPVFFFCRLEFGLVFTPRWYIHKFSFLTKRG